MPNSRVAFAILALGLLCASQVSARDAFSRKLVEGMSPEGESYASAPAPGPLGQESAGSVPPFTVLNFALNLECLEAQFYSCAAFGKPLSEELTGGGPAPVGCEKANLSSYSALAADIANNEIAHVAFLRSALGADAVQCPQVDIGPAFAAAANAAVNSTLSPAFSPYLNDLFFLVGAFIFEDVGVTAYKGAAPLLASNADLLTAAAGILAVEAYHAGSIRTQLIATADTPTPYGATVGQVIAAISNLRDTLDGPAEDLDQGLSSPTNPAILSPVDANGIAFSRTPEQVLAIVYGGAVPGLFFPEGLNGEIH